MLSQNFKSNSETPTSISTSRRCRFCLCSSWTGLSRSSSMVPCIRKWDMTRLIDRSETSTHIAIWSLLRNFDSRRMVHCISDEIFVPRGMTTKQLASAAQNDILFTRHPNSETLEICWMLLGQWWWPPVSFSTSFGIVSGEKCRFVVELWLIDCCESLVTVFFNKNSHVANPCEKDSNKNLPRALPN